MPGKAVFVHAHSLDHETPEGWIGTAELCRRLPRALVDGLKARPLRFCNARHKQHRQNRERRRARLQCDSQH
jgi:hypothetical protein